MSAHEELRALAQRYGRAVDDRDVEALARLFHPDAVIDGVRGVQPLDAWLDGMRGPRAFQTSMHFVGDPLIEIADEGTTAALDTYAVVYQLGETGDLTLGIRYTDEAVVHEGRWVIRRRTSRTIWTR